MLKFQEFYETYAPEVYRFAYWLVGNGFDAEDITSETFVRAWVRFSTIRTETLKAYLFKITRNIFLEELRKSKNQTALHEMLPDPAIGVEAKVESQQRLTWIQHFLWTLPEIDRAAFILRVQHELPYGEIARILECSVGAARVKVHRVRKRLIEMSIEKEDERL